METRAGDGDARFDPCPAANSPLLSAVIKSGQLGQILDPVIVLPLGAPATVILETPAKTAGKADHTETSTSSEKLLL